MPHNKYKRWFSAFLIVNAVCWTIVPTLTRNILPLDTIEAIVWGSGWSFGTAKHPPLSGWIAESFYRIFGHADISQYFLSQLLVVIGIVAVYALGKLFLSREEATVGSLTLFFIYFYNYTTPEYNVNVLELAFWPLTALVFYHAILDDRLWQWLLFGAFSALIMWTKYFSGLLLFSLFVYMLIDKKARGRFRSSGPYLAVGLFFLLYLPHFRWLHLHDYMPIVYAAERTTAEDGFQISTYFINLLRLLPLTIGILLPAILALYFSYGNVHYRELWKRIRGFLDDDENGGKFFLTLLVVPLLVMQLLAIVGVGIRSMWYTPVFFAAGPLLVLFFRPWWKVFCRRRFTICLIAVSVFFISLFTVSTLTHTSKRVNFPATEFCNFITQKIGDPADGKEVILLGDYWSTGMLHCYLPDHPVAINCMDVCWDDRIASALQKMRQGKAVIVFTISVGDYFEDFMLRHAAPIEPRLHLFSCKAPFGKVKKAEIFYDVVIK